MFNLIENISNDLRDLILIEESEKLLGHSLTSFERGWARKKIIHKCVICEEPKENRINNFKNRIGLSHKHCKQEKIKRTNLERYGVEYPLQSDGIREKTEQTRIEKYGTQHVSQCDDIKEKKKKTFLKNYGVDNPSKSKKIQDKRKKNCLRKHGVENISQLQSVKDKRKRTNLKKYGVEHFLQSEDVRVQIKKTNIKKYGVEYPAQSDHYRKLKMKRFYNSLMNGRLNYKVVPQFSFDQYDGVNGNKYPFRCITCSTIFNDYLDNGHIPRCPECYPANSSTSMGEKEVSEFIKSQDISIKENRRIIYPYEIDILIEDLKLGIEYDGLYWHSEGILRSNNRKDSINYHLNKMIRMNKKGYQLIHIFEDEWFNKQTIVKHRLKNILGVNDSVKVYARQCDIKEIDSNTKNQFLEEFHLQGSDKSSIRLGAYCNGELISVMTFGLKRLALGSKSHLNEYELIRFCSNYDYRVVGIASKLLKYFIRVYNPKRIISYADRRWSNGNLYYKLGFEHVGFSDPNYWYMKNYKSREHRFNYRKDKLVKEGEDPTLTEWQIMQLRGYDRIWDCGNYKFEMNLT